MEKALLLACVVVMTTVVPAAGQPESLRPADRPTDRNLTAFTNRTERRMLTVLREGRSQLDPKTVRALEDNLRVIDQAIAAARTALAGDSANVYLNEHLARNMQQKLGLLRRATAIVSGQS